MARRTNNAIDAAAFKRAVEIVEKIQPLWVDGMSPQIAAYATHELILSTLRIVRDAAQQTLVLETET